MEEKELDLFVGKKQKILTTRILGFKKNWYLTKMSLEVMAMLVKEFHKLDQDDDAINSDNEKQAISAIYNSILENADTCGNVLAIAVKSRLPKWIVKRHLLRNVDARELSHVVSVILKESNLVNFSVAISGMQMMMKMLKPTEIAEE